MASSDSSTLVDQCAARRIAFLRAAWAADRSARWASFRRHWPMEVFDLVCDMGFGFLAGVALGLASLVSALATLGGFSL